MSDERPLPIITDQNRPFWQAASERRFVLPACHACRKLFFPIGPVCPHCHSMELGWAAASGRGRVYERVTDEITLPQFVPVHGGSTAAAAV